MMSTSRAPTGRRLYFGHSDATFMPLAPGTRFGPFEIAGLIGAGGMGEVYRARDTKLDRDVALKVVDAASTSMMRIGNFR